MIELSLSRPVKPHSLVISSQGILLISNKGDTQLFPYPEQSYSDLTIVNEEVFSQAFEAWLKEQKKEEGPFTILIENDVMFIRYFENEIDQTTKQPISKNQDVKRFIESIPFASVMSEKYEMAKKGFIIAAVNRDLVDPVLTKLKNLDASILGVAPIVALDLNTEVTQHDQETLIAFSSKVDAIKKKSFKPVHTSLGTYAEGTEKREPDKKRLVLLIIVFFGLIFMMILLLIFGSE